MAIAHIFLLVAFIALAATIVAGIGVLLVAGAGMLLTSTTSPPADSIRP